MELGLLTISVILQATAGFMAWRMMFAMPSQWLWGVIAAAISLIAIWWVIPLFEAWHSSGPIVGLPSPYLALGISSLFLIAMVKFGPVLRRLEENRALLLSMNISLELEAAERERAEAALKRNEELWRGAVEGLQEAFALYDAENKLIYWNEDWARLHPFAKDIIRVGMPYEELVRTQVACGAIPAAKGREDDFIRERLELHENPQGEMLREYADGTWFIIKESRTSGGGYVATNTDITELKRTEARLLESERRMSQLIEALQDGFALFDADERLVMWNQKWFNRHSGAAEVIEVGVSFEDLSRAMVRADQIPEAVGREEEFVAERVERHRNPGMPMQRKMNDGRWFIIHEVRTSEGGILSLQTEITDVKRAEETAHELRLEAELANRAKSSLLINMSHELRTPLNAIIGFSQILEQELFGPLGNARYVNYARDVHNSGKHLLALISDLLDISKVELGEAELEESEIDLAECIASCIVMVEHRAMNSGIEVTNEIDPSVGSLKADERRLKQIILNIAGNAIKFSPPKATVAIKTEALESGACKISISDEGPGIDAEEISRITEPFFQTETGLTRQTDGIGLGLYIVSTLCDLHGADLVFDSVPDKGTTVSVIFPPERLGIDRDSQAAE